MESIIAALEKLNEEQLRVILSILKDETDITLDS